MKYLIYGLVDPVTSQLRYIGKSSSGLYRPKSHTTKSVLERERNCRTHKNNWINHLLSLDKKPNIVVIQQFEDSEILNKAEIFWIRYFKDMGCDLTNGTDGGDGTINPTPEYRMKVGDFFRGRKQSPEQIAKKKKSCLDTIYSKYSDEMIQQLSDLYSSGIRLVDVAAKFNIHESTLRRVFRHFKIPTMKRGFGGNKGRLPTRTPATNLTNVNTFKENLPQMPDSGLVSDRS